MCAESLFIASLTCAYRGVPEQLLPVEFLHPALLQPSHQDRWESRRAPVRVACTTEDVRPPWQILRIGPRQQLRERIEARRIEELKHHPPPVLAMTDIVGSTAENAIRPHSPRLA